MFEFFVPAQARVPVAHSHETFDETVYGLSGVLTWMLDDRASPCRTGRRPLYPSRARASLREP